MENIPSIQWFPGHMAKTRRLIKENLKLVDIVIELCDARIPGSSRNPEMQSLTEGKAKLIILNKCSIADNSATKMWIEYYNSIGEKAIAIDSKSGYGFQNFIPAVYDVLKDKMEARKNKGTNEKYIKMMIVGIPNVGKSSFINKFANSKRARVEDRPGVTRGKQWVKINDDIELLDMPGVLWPKFEDPMVGLKLAFTGAVKDDVIDIELLSIRLLDILKVQYTSMVIDRYKLSEDDEISEMDSYDLLQLIGKKRGMLVSGGEVNTERAAIMLIDEYRSGKFGNITLEFPEKPVNTDK